MKAKPSKRQYTSIKEFATLTAEQIQVRWNPPKCGMYECMELVPAAKGENIPSLMDRLRSVTGQCVIIWELTASRDEAINAVLEAGSLKDIEK